MTRPAHDPGSKPTTPTYTLTIRPVPPGRDRLNREPIHRLRAFLKSMLRRHGYRCIHITPDPRQDSRAEPDHPADLSSLPSLAAVPSGATKPNTATEDPPQTPQPP